MSKTKKIKTEKITPRSSEGLDIRHKFISELRFHSQLPSTAEIPIFYKQKQPIKEEEIKKGERGRVRVVTFAYCWSQNKEEMSRFIKEHFKGILDILKIEEISRKENRIFKSPSPFDYRKIDKKRTKVIDFYLNFKVLFKNRKKLVSEFSSYVNDLAKLSNSYCKAKQKKIVTDFLSRKYKEFGNKKITIYSNDIGWDQLANIELFSVLEEFKDEGLITSIPILPQPNILPHYTDYLQLKRRNINNLSKNYNLELASVSLTPKWTKELQRYFNKDKSPYKVSAGTQWKSITIKFLNDQEILIKTPDYEKKAGFRDFNLFGYGKDVTSIVWEFFRVLAQYNGELDWSNPEAEDKNKSRKLKLARSLQKTLGIESDPFFPYRPSPDKPEKYYKARFTLFCDKEYKKELKERTREERKESSEDNSCYSDIEEFYNSQTPSRYE